MKYARTFISGNQHIAGGSTGIDYLFLTRPARTGIHNFDPCSPATVQENLCNGFNQFSIPPSKLEFNAQLFAFYGHCFPRVDWEIFGTNWMEIVLRCFPAPASRISYPANRRETRIWRRQRKGIESTKAGLRDGTTWWHTAEGFAVAHPGITYLGRRPYSRRARVRGWLHNG